MNSAMRALSGIVITAASMYFLDPLSGRRRRAVLRDRFRSAARREARELNAGVRDLGHRIEGLAALARSPFDHRHAEDSVVAERVRSALGRSVSHPGALDVSVSSGHVALKGTILAREHPGLLTALLAIRGVTDIDDRQLAVYEDGRRIPALQGGRVREPAGFELLEDHWSPAARLLTSVMGLGLLLYGLRSGRLLGAVSGAAGGVLLVRSRTNMPWRRLAGTSGDTIQIQKTLRVHAPVERVFAALTQYENFPHFMRNVRSVRAHPDGRSHWCVVGPAGTSVEWDSETTSLEPGKLIAWRTVPQATVQHSGSIRLRADKGGTCLQIHLSYSPPAGILGHGVAKLFGVDPKKELDEDMMRLKSFLETGTPPRDRAGRLAGAPPVVQAASAAAASHAAEQPIH